MKRPVVTLAVASATVVAATASAMAAGGAAAGGADPGYGANALTGRAVLASSTVREGSAPSGAFFGAGDRTSAAGNGLTLPASGPAFDHQPVQGISGLIPTGTAGEFWSLSDNGFGARANSADWQLWVNKVVPAFAAGAASPGPVSITGGFGLSDPQRHIPWTIVCDPTGDPLPPLAGNTLPATPPQLCGDPAARRLTGFDFDPESMQLGPDGTFWFGEEFGPFLLHTNARGVLLEAPIPTPGVKAPQNPTLDVAAGERPNLNGSKGFEGLGISPDRRTLYPLLEGPVTGDARTDLRLHRFDIATRTWKGYDIFRLELPGPAVNTATILRPDGSPAYPGDPAPATLIGNDAIGELTVVNKTHALVIERDGGGDAPAVPRFKKVFLITLPGKPAAQPVAKTALVDLMAVPDRDNTGGDGPFFRFPYTTIESVTPVDDHTLVLVDDNNYPFSNGRSFSQGGTAGNGLRPDDNEFIRVHVGTDLDVDRRVLTPGRRGKG